MFASLLAAPATAPAHRLFEGLTVVDIYQIGLGFILGSCTTVLLLLILDFARDTYQKQNAENDETQG